MKGKTLTKKLMACLLTSCMMLALVPISSFKVEAADKREIVLGAVDTNGFDAQNYLDVFNGLPWEGNGNNAQNDGNGNIQSWVTNMINDTNTEINNTNTEINNNSNNTTVINYENNSHNNNISNETNTITNTITDIDMNSHVDMNSHNNTLTDIDMNSHNNTIDIDNNLINNTQNLSYVGSGTWEAGRNSSEWRLKKPDGSYAMSQWGCIDGRWYLFGNEGYTCSGWQKVDGKWYYLMSDGSMLTNTTTPDGHEVNENGEWVVNGIVQTN